MDDHPKLALKSAVLASLPILREQVGRFSEPYLVWRKVSKGQWSGTYEDRPSLQRTFRAARKELEEATAGFASEVLANHPEYSNLVGLAGFGHHRILNSDRHIPTSALRRLWFKYRSFDCDEASVDTIADEFGEFLERPTVHLRLQAQLLNFKMDGNELALPDDLTIRRLSEEEVSRLDGGALTTLGFVRPRFSGPHEFVIEGTIEVTKQVGPTWAPAPSGVDLAKTRLNKAILCLRTFKTGHVGYDYVRFMPVKFCPVATGSYGCGDLYVPFGSYHVSEDEEKPLQDYAGMFFQAAEPAMETACSRLADAETRTRPQDRLVDAVIGMEALLLAALKGDDRKGELSYRFSLHYSTMFDTPEERYQGFRVARDLYHLRSTIAHGSVLKNDQCRVGGEKMKLDSAASRATAALRQLIGRFLPEANVAPYRRPEFWQRAYFGLEEDTTT